MIEDAKRVITASDVPWDELRERRVLARIEATLAAREQEHGLHDTLPRPRATPPVPQVRRVWFAAAGMLVAGLAAALLLLFSTTWLLETPAPAAELASLDQGPRRMHGFLPAIPPARPLPEQAPSRMSLPDGSTAELFGGAEVDISSQAEDLVRLQQPHGRVRYSVTPNPARRFIVDAAGVQVRVLGTIFVVTVEVEHVRVEVERGKVEVASGEHTTTLVAGEELLIPAPTVDPPKSSRPARRSSTPSVEELPIKRAPGPIVANAEALLMRADKARAQGKLVDAVAALNLLVRHYPADTRAYSSYFQLGKLERTRRHHAAAAAAFSACYDHTPTGALSEDAQAEAAASWLAAEAPAQARKTASAYLEHYPAGVHAARMRHIIDRTR